MKRFKLRRPSAPMIIAIVALIAALGGTAIAGGGFLKKTKFQNFKKNNNATLATTVKGPITYVSNTQSVNTTAATPAGAGQNITAACPSDFFPVGGGAKTSTPSQNSNFAVLNSYPSATGWTELVYAGSAGPPVSEQVTVTAICEKAKTTGTPPSITN
jgi:hypothetical protein